jgi:hypothetical protein
MAVEPEPWNGTPVTGAKMDPIHVLFWPHFSGLQGRMGWLEAAFPRQSCVWEDDFEAFSNRAGAMDGADVGFGAVIVINGAASPAPDLRLLSDQMRSFRWVLFVSIGDEGSGLHLEWLDHPKASIWVYDGKPGKHDKYHRLPAGPINEILEFLPRFQTEMREKPLDWFASGSIRDIKWDSAIQALPRNNGLFYPHHLVYPEYTQHLAKAKVVPCRPCLSAPETCRLYDALEAGCVPIVGIYPLEAQCQHCRLRIEHPHMHQWWPDYNYDWLHYWEYVLGEKPPFPIISDPSELADAVQNTLADWPENAQRVHAWWMDYKTRLVDRLRADVRRRQQ